MALSPEREQQIREARAVAGPNGAYSGAMVDDLLAELDRLRAEFREAMDNYHGEHALVKKLRAELTAARGCRCYPNPLDHETDCPARVAVVPAAGEPQ
jgi:hypothetical protein